MFGILDIEHHFLVTSYRVMWRHFLLNFIQPLDLQMVQMLALTQVNDNVLICLCNSLTHPRVHLR